MNEKMWVKIVVEFLNKIPDKLNSNILVSQGMRIPYVYEIQRYLNDKPVQSDFTAYETDILISEEYENGEWKPRIVIEAKLSRITTHDAITYSEKAISHKRVHPYLRYGIIIGNRKHYPLPGRLFRHGVNFDFMISWRSYDPDESESKSLKEIVRAEIQASQTLEEILYSSRSPKRKKYITLHKPLRLME